MHTPEDIEGDATEIPPTALPVQQADAEQVEQGPVTPIETPKLETECGGCHRKFEFPVEPGLEYFEYTCSACGSENKVAIG